MLLRLLLAVALPLNEVEPVLDGLAPAGSDAVGEALTVAGA